MSSQLFQHYDFIVIGDHSSGLYAALQALKNSKKVLVIPTETHSGRNVLPRMAVDLLELDPELIPSRELDPIQVITPKRRFRVYSSEQRFADEFQFVFGKTLSNQDLPEPNLARALAFLDRGFEGGPVLPEDWKTILSRLNELVFFSSQPRGWVQEQFFNRIRTLGGHVAPTHSIQSIFVEQGAFVGVQLLGSSSLIRADHVFVSASWDYVSRFLSEKSKVESSPIGWVMSLELEINQDGIPPGLTSFMLFSQQEAPLVEIRHDGQGGFKVDTLLPFHDRYLSRVEQRKIAQRLFVMLSEFIPDLQYNLKRISLDVRDPERCEEIDLPRLFPFHTLAEIPPQRLRYALPGLGVKTPFTGMSFAYEEALPKWGEWGAYQAVSEILQN